MSLQSQPPLFTIPPAADLPEKGPAWPLWATHAIAVASGAVFLVVALAPAVGEAPTVAVAGVAAFGLFGALCAWLLGNINYFRKPGPRTRLMALLWGGFAATGYALLANTAVHGHLAASGSADGWSLFAPLVEEPAKNIGIVVVLLLAGIQPRTALDGLVAGAFVGLGFEIVESVARSLNNAVASYPPGQRDNLGSLTVDVTHEVLRNSWTGHIVLTGIAGFGIGYFMTATGRSLQRRWAVAAALILLAFAGHLLWNSHRFGLLYVVGQFGLLFFFLWLIRVGRGLEGAVYAPYLRYAPGLAHAAEIDAMTSDATRRAFRRTRSAGDSTLDGRRRRRALADLAAAIANGDAQRAHRSAEALRGSGMEVCQPER